MSEQLPAERLFRKKPVVVLAVRWLGGDYEHLNRFCGNNWGRADAKDEIGPADSESVVVWNMLEKQWLNVPIGDWIIRGVRGEFYPCNPDVFEETYEPALQLSAETSVAWVAVGHSLPCFICFGFPTKRKVQFKLADGTEYEDIYQGWGIFGAGHGFDREVTHWRSSEADVVLHQMPHAHDAIIQHRRCWREYGCEWRADEDGVWNTGCGRAFVLDNEGPIANDMKYCCYCGLVLDELPYDEPEDDDE